MGGMNEKEEEAKAEKKKGGRKAKSAPAIIETTKEVEEAPVVRKGRAASKAATEKIANDVKELSNLGAKKRRPDEDEAKKSQEEKESSAPPAKRATRARK